MTKRGAQKFQGVSVRTDGEGLDERIDRVVAELAKRGAGIAPKKNTVARNAMLRGLEAIERELGLS